MQQNHNVLSIRHGRSPSPRLSPHRPHRALIKNLRLAVILACFNRRETTLRCLNALFSQDVSGCEFQVFVLDDGSTDGTSQAIAERFSEVILLKGTGSLFWNGGMRKAFAEALNQDFDYYLWLNDDTVLFDSALTELLNTAVELKKQGRDAIVAGNTRNPGSREHTYGGITARTDLRPNAFRLQPPHPQKAVPCDTMNGNCTLIPRSVVHAIGNLDPAFRHNFGDVDYGLRARTAGFDVYSAPGFVGTCPPNSDRGTWRDRKSPLGRRWAHINSPKGCPWSEWVLFSRRHLGPLWFLYALSPYAKVVFQSFTTARLR